MNKESLRLKLHEWTNHAVSLSSERVIEILPPLYKYRASIGMEPMGLLSPDDFLNLIWQEPDCVREWVNLGIETIEDGYTIVRSPISKKFIRYDELLGLRKSEATPFVIGLPVPPPGWLLKSNIGLPRPAESLETNGKYSIFWRHK